MIIQSFHLIGDCFEAIIQARIHDMQCLLEFQVEIPVVGVHLVEFLGVLLPDLIRTNRMEGGSVILPESHHVCYLLETFIIAGGIVVPDHGTTALNDAVDGLHLDGVMHDLRHHAGEDALIDAGEAFGIQQIADFTLGKALAKMIFVLQITGNAVESSVRVTVQPVGHEIIAPGLMRHRDKAIQPCQKFRTQCASRCGQHDVRR